MKGESRQKTEQESKEKSGQKDEQKTLLISFQALKQKNLTDIALKLSILTSIGILGRSAFQWLPSVEPIVPLAIAIGFFFGYKYALPAGMGAFYLSNFFVWGWQGPWTLFQVAGTGAAALAGHALGRLSQSKYSFFSAAVIGTVFYEILADLSWLWLFGFFGITSLQLAFVGSLPFSAIHIASSFGFAMVIYAFKDKILELNREDILYELKVFAGRRFGSGDSSFWKLPRRADNRFRIFGRRKPAGKSHNR